MQRLTRLITLLGAALLTTSASAQKTFILEDATDFTGNGCEIWDINDGFVTLEQAMDAAGWNGERYVWSDIWPHDWYESCSTNYGNPAFDDWLTDAKTVAGYSGHGSEGMLHFPVVQWGTCDASLGTNMRLGSMNGSEAGFAMYLTCYTMAINALASGANKQWLRQQYGFRNFVGIGSDEARDFFNATNTTVNQTAWVNQMDGSGRQPISVTYGTDNSNCLYIRNAAKLKANVFLRDRDEAGPSCNANNPSFWYCYTTVN